MRLVLDTCALLWWTLEPSRLSQGAAGALADLREEDPPAVCAASFWEIALKQQAGRLDLGMAPAEYLSRARRLPLRIEPVGAELWLESVSLEWAHRDPVDRLVVALARREGARLVTADEAILRFYPRAVW